MQGAHTIKVSVSVVSCPVRPESFPGLDALQQCAAGRHEVAVERFIVLQKLSSFVVVKLTALYAHSPRGNTADPYNRSDLTLDGVDDVAHRHHGGGVEPEGDDGNIYSRLPRHPSMAGVRDDMSVNGHHRRVIHGYRVLLG